MYLLARLRLNPVMPGEQPSPVEDLPHLSILGYSGWQRPCHAKQKSKPLSELNKLANTWVCQSDCTSILGGVGAVS